MPPGFQATTAELALVNQIFAQADTQKIGILTGDVAVNIFGGAKLPPTVLGEIWSLADEENNGWLSKKGVAIAVRLMGWAQKGDKVDASLINKPGPIPTIEGVTAVTAQTTGISLSRSPPPPSALPPFTAQDKAKFANLFMKHGPTNGLLSGEQARDIFVKSKLPTESLLQIWNLADTKDRGALDATDFAIGMYLIQAIMSRQIATIPTSLPPGLYQQAGGLPSSNPGSVRSHATGASGSFSPVQSTFARQIQPQYTGQNMLQPDNTGYTPSYQQQAKPAAPHLPARPNPSKIGTGAFSPRQGTGAPAWDVTAAEKANADDFFSKLDAQRLGYIEGDIVVPFMRESNLPDEDLAQIWDLADIKGDGRLTRDGFAVAMYLIQKRLSGAEIPSALPLSLIPPSMRSTNGASPFSPAQPPPEPARDLFSWDDATPPQSANAPPTTGPFSVPVHQTGSQPSHPTSYAPPPIPPRSVSQDPFGSSTFGGFDAGKNLLDDDEETGGTTSPPLQDQSAEIGNAQNQNNSTNRALETTKGERASVEEALANQAAQLSALQTQLASAKASYETETKLLSTLRERYSTQTADIRKTREELIRAESDLSAVRVEKAEVEGLFLRDKEEARDLHRKMVEAGQLAETTKHEVEKVKKEAKQQKGLLAIARKQLSTKEAEKLKAEKDLLEAQAEAASTTKEREDVEAELERVNATVLPTAPTPQRGISNDSLLSAAGYALPVSPDPASPAASVKSNNPFGRLTKSPSGNNTPRSQSPFLPFAGSSLVTSPIINGSSPEAAADDDPFGFSQSLEADAPAPPAQDTPDDDAVAADSTPKIPPISIPVNGSSSASNTAVSPMSTSNTDDFTTPPTSSAGRPEVASPQKQSTVDVVLAKFPALDDISSGAPVETSIPGHLPDATPEPSHETDLDSSLKEIEVEESDSDSDSDDDEVPLAELKGKGKEVAATPAPQVNGAASPPADTSSTTFDDIFGVTQSTEPAAPSNSQTTKAATDAFGLPIQGSSSPFESSDTFDAAFAPKAEPAPEAATPVAGVNAFDEAMGKIPTSAPSNAPAFTFDSAFDDNFDFASSEPAFPPPPKAANGHATSGLPVTNKNDGFEGLFTPQPNNNRASVIFPDPKPVASPVVSTPVVQASAAQPAQSGGGPSFDEVFSGFDSGPALNLDATVSSGLSQPGSPAQKAFPTVSTPTSAKSASPSRLGSNRPISPVPRERTPPPRVGSPKSRSSLSSGGHDKPKDKLKEEKPPPRHSKLSIRLPFGRKKKQESIPLPPSQLLTPPQEEEPSRIQTPAVDDDVEGVKQLTAMGFSRTQAVAALEKYGYDVPRALNSLLGAP